MRVVFVGEAVSEAGGLPFDGKNRAGSERRGGSGWRLAKILYTTPDKMRARYSFMNLSRGMEWDRHRATTKASLLRGSLMACGERAVIVLLGRRVAEAFGYRREFFTLGEEPIGRLAYVSLPHPSGRSRVWNDEASVLLAQRALREAGVL